MAVSRDLRRNRPVFLRLCPALTRVEELFLLSVQKN